LTDNRLRALLPKSSSSEENNGEYEALPNVYAIGDCAQIKDRPLPATAQVASQKGKHLAFVLNGQMDIEENGIQDDNGEAIFKHKDMGSMASLGSGSAIVDSPKAKAQGRVGPFYSM
jgi:NADH dehydrogenase FAD-containing subunit